jgi:hypothetical protein
MSIHVTSTEEAINYLLVVMVTFGFLYFSVWRLGKQFRVSWGFEPKKLQRIRLVLSGLIISVWTCFYISLVTIVLTLSSLAFVIVLSYLLVLTILPAFIDLKRQFSSISSNPVN